ncbi:GNAT family N-acetyltransferase [Nocardia puris]|uniref:Acetyltransferase (GNAT) family protein n=1 Tax=Nocardia puris TaxID=208602 RepID=A0A366DMN4_9NOCA|nr:GNAT family N-acetyltransferase [Nocardia puris]RBO91350.1 acetyltransferase (GNAT) family protein [Nocardia puris]
MPEFRRFDNIAARGIRDVVQDVYRRSYVDAIASGDPFDSPVQFMQRFDNYTNAAGFDLVVAFIAGEPVGQSWGWPLRQTSRWWEGLALDTPDPTFVQEDGSRTFALSEVMVCASHTGRGLGRSLHDELLRTRPEQRATLLVDPDNQLAYAAYRRWGWHRVGTLRPSWENAPTFDVLIRDLSTRANADEIAADG